MCCLEVNGEHCIFARPEDERDEEEDGDSKGKSKGKYEKGERHFVIATGNDNEDKGQRGGKYAKCSGEGSKDAEQIPGSQPQLSFELPVACTDRFHEETTHSCKILRESTLNTQRWPNTEPQGIPEALDGMV